MTITNSTALRATVASPAPGALTDHELLTTLPRLVAHERRATVALIAHLAELDARRLYRGAGFSSAHAYCVHVLHLSEHAAYLRIEAARSARRFPRLLAELAAGRLHLTALAQLGPHLTAENLDEVLAAARHRTRREIDTLVERIRTTPPRPAPARCELRAVPTSWRAAGAPAPGAAGGAAGSTSGPARAAGTALPGGTPPGQLFAGVPATEGLDSRERTAGKGDLHEGEPRGGGPREGDPREDNPGAACHREAGPAGPGRLDTLPSDAPPAEPPAADTVCYRLHVTIRAATRAKLERARALLGRTAEIDAAVDPEAAILDRALDLLLERLERRKWGRRRAEGGPSRRGKRAPAGSGTSMPSANGASHTLALAAAAAHLAVVSPTEEGMSAAGVTAPVPPVGAAAREADSGAPTAADTAARASRHIPASVRRAVFRRDGGRCAFVAPSGRRCPATRGLEFHHREPWARGGAATVSNIALFCRAHNAYEAEREFGEAPAAEGPKWRQGSRAVSPAPPVTGARRPANGPSSVRTEFAPG